MKEGTFEWFRLSSLVHRRRGSSRMISGTGKYFKKFIS